MLCTGTVPIILVTVQMYQCRSCGYEWFPKDLRNPGNPPKTCSRCHNPYWNEPRVYKIKKLAKRLVKRSEKQ